MKRQLNKKSTPKLPKSERWGGKMRTYKAKTASGSLQGFLFSGLLLLAGMAAIAGNQAFAQDAAASCAPAAARVVSLQGNVEVQRAGATGWNRVNRLDTGICAGDRLRTDALSRAALFVQPETLVRVDQNTTISLSQTTDEVLVEFHTGEISQTARNAQACGAGYFITRFPRKFKVTTAHMNAAVEGTEFMVESSCDATKLTVLEGQVVSQSAATQETRSLTAGQRLESGPAVGSAFSTVVRPADAVQWVLRYPPLSDASAEAEVPSAEQCQALPEGSRPACLTGRAEVLLRLGRVDESLHEIDQAISLDAGNSDANALRAIIQIAKNDTSAARESAGKATAADQNNQRAWLALSYAQQASFELEKALESARKAQALQADSSLIHSRIAELLLTLGYAREAEVSARSAVGVNPDESNAHTILGFVHLAQIDTEAARADFAAAIERDSFNALPRLGLGLAMIRDGELTGGREQIEIAVALDPRNSLLRSYVGKAYYEENSRERTGLAETQFQLAREYDPNDPTSWLYDAIRLQTMNRPIEAVHALQKSIELNENRAVYRSRELLAEDNAVRAISLARAYQEVGFDKLAIRESAVSVSADPDNSSAHRFLADSYLTLPRHEIARRSELLQAQLRQPLNSTPIQPQLTEDNFFVLKAAGPTAAGFHEYTPLFTQNGLALQVDLLGGNLDTWGDQVILSGLSNRTAFAVSQLAYSTDGVRINDEFEKRLLSGFIQIEPAFGTSFQAEVRHSDSEFGDPLLAFDPELVIDDRHDFRDSRARVGFRRNLGSGSDFIISVTGIDQRETINSSGFLAIEQDTRTYIAEVQHVLKRPQFNLVTGVGYDTETQDLKFFGFPARFRPQAANAYAYVNYSPFEFPLTAHIAGSVDYLADRDDLLPSRTQFNPKIGVTLSPWRGATVRAAAFDVLRRQFAESQTLEPTQVAGFNQFYDDFAATEARRAAIAIDQSLTEDLFVGAEFSRRDLTVPQDFTGEEFEWEERNAEVHVYWAPTNSVALTLAVQQEEFSRPVNFPGRELIADVETRSLPLGLTVNLRNMLFARIVNTYVKQSGQFFFLAALPDPVPAEDTFWITDISLGYRLPRRSGTLSVDVRNLFDEEFQFHETDLFTRQFAKERIILFRASLAF